MPLCVSSGQVFRWSLSEAGRWIGVDGGSWFAVRIAEAGGDVAYEVESNAAEENFRRLFRLDSRLSEITRRILAVDPSLRSYVEALPGLRVLAPSDPEEVVFSFLCTANNNMSRIVPMVRGLASYGEPLADIDGQAIFRFPQATRIATIPEADLRGRGYGYRARTIPEVASFLACKPPAWLESLKEVTYEEAHAALRPIPGIGPKLADCIALFGLHHIDAAPVDTHLWQAACRHYFPEWRGKALTDVRYRAVGDRFRETFGDLAGWAHQYLFYENLLNWRTRQRGKIQVP